MPRDDRANWHPPSDRLGPQLVAALRMLLALSWRARRSASARADRRCWPPARWEPRPGWPAPPWTVTPVGGLTALGPILLGEVSPGGVGTGLYAMLVFVLLTVFLAGLLALGLALGLWHFNKHYFATRSGD